MMSRLRSVEPSSSDNLRWRVRLRESMTVNGDWHGLLLVDRDADWMGSDQDLSTLEQRISQALEYGAPLPRIESQSGGAGVDLQHERAEQPGHGLGPWCLLMLTNVRCAPTARRWACRHSSSVSAAHHGRTGLTSCAAASCWRFIGEAFHTY